jgi:hypothetical protein
LRFPVKLLKQALKKLKERFSPPSLSNQQVVLKTPELKIESR